MYLPAVDNLLIEDTELVADAVTVRCQPQRGHGVQEASWKNRAWSCCKEPRPSLAALAMACCAWGGEELLQPMLLETFITQRKSACRRYRRGQPAAATHARPAEPPQTPQSCW